MKIPSYIKAVIFDMDGLMIDSEPYWRQTTEEFFAKHKKPFHQEIHHSITGLGLREMMEYFKSEHGFEGEIDEMIAERKEMVYSLLLQDVQLMEGADELIRKLYKKSMPLAIATSAHTKDKIDLMLNKFGIVNMFRFFVSGEDVEKAKPAPDIYLKTAKLLHVAPKNCLVLEDSPNGVKAGKAAGMLVYSINADEAIYQKLKSTGVDKVFQSLTEIL